MWIIKQNKTKHHTQHACVSVWVVYITIIKFVAHLATYLSMCMSVRVSVCMSVRVSVCSCVCLFVCLSVRVSACSCVCLSIYLYVCLSVYQYVCLSVCIFVFLYVCLSVCLYICMNFLLLLKPVFAADRREAHRSAVSGVVTAVLLVVGGDPRPSPCLRNLAGVL